MSSGYESYKILTNTKNAEAVGMIIVGEYYYVNDQFLQETHLLAHELDNL